MTWLRIDDGLHGHPKVEDMLQEDPSALAAMGLWTLCLSHCGHYLTDGHVRKSIARRYGGERFDALAATLVRAGLWDTRDDDGWSFHDYLMWNPSKEQVLRERSERQQRARAAAEKRWGNNRSPSGHPIDPHANQHATTHAASHAQAHTSQQSAQHNGSNAPVPSRPVPSLNPPNPPDGGHDASRQQEPRPDTGPLPAGVVSFERTFWVAAYERGVDAERSPRSDRFTFPQKTFKTLLSVVEKQCVGKDRERIDVWIESNVRSFVRAILNRNEDAKFWSSFGPDGLLRWYNEGRPGMKRPREPKKVRAETTTTVGAFPAEQNLPLNSPETGTNIRHILSSLTKKSNGS